MLHCMIFHFHNHEKHLWAYSWMEDLLRGFVFTYFFQLEAFSDASMMRMENVPKSQTLFQNSEPWWLVLNPTTGSAASPLNRRCQHR